jgi:hypothetical protein
MHFVGFNSFIHFYLFYFILVKILALNKRMLCALKPLLHL